MATLRPNLPLITALTDKLGMITTSWSYWFSVVATQLPPPGQIYGQEMVVTNTTSTYTVGQYDSVIICNFAGTTTLTLPSAVTNPGRKLNIRTITANTVVSASANVAPLVGGAAGTAILAATAGKWAVLISDGVDWDIQNAN